MTSMEKPEIRLVALDIDGTMLTDEGKLTSRTRNVLRRLPEQGVSLTLSTGRLYFGVLDLLEQLNISLPVITSNGARLVDPLSGDTLFEQRIPLPLAKEVLSFAESCFGGDIFVNDTNGFWIDQGNSLLLQPHPDPALQSRIRRSTIVQQLSSELDCLPLKISLVTRTGEDIQSLSRRLNQHFHSLLEIAPSSEASLDINAKGVSKGQALRFLCERLGMDLQGVMAAGNAENDTEMIRLAGLGVAMANAPEGVRQVADCLAGNNNEEGLAQLLETLFDL